MSELVLENQTLPTNWIMTNIESVCVDSQYGWTTSASDHGDVKFLRTTDITSGKINWKTVPYCEKSPDDLNKYLLKNDDVVISRAGSIGFSYLIESPPKAVFASYLIRFNPLIFPKYFNYFLQSSKYWNEISEKKIGIAVQNVNATKLKQIKFPLSPLNEQKKIVAKIEELFAILDSTKQSLENSKNQLKQYLQSLLKSAFEGKLTEKWRHENECSVESELNVIRKLNDKKLKTDSKLTLDIPENTFDLHKIPNKWVWIRLGFLSKLITKGASPKWQGIEYVDNGILFITSENIGSGKILLNKPKYLEKKFNEIQKRSILQKGDILTNIVGASIGRTAIYDLDNTANINQAVSLIRIYDQTNKKYIQYVLNSPSILNYMNREKVDVARANLSLQNVADFPIPLPSLKEQELIVLKLEQGFSLIKNIENITNSMLKQLDTIKLSILKQAFEGKLVPQDPNDEPAEVLLQKINQEKQQLIQKQKPSRSTKNVK